MYVTRRQYLTQRRASLELLSAALVLVFGAGPSVTAQPQRQPMANRATTGSLTAGSFAPSKSATTDLRSALKQPEFLEQYASTRRFSSGHPASVHITHAGDAVLFLRSGPRSSKRDLYEFNVATGTERVLATAAQLLRGAEEKLSAEEKARRERMRLSAGGIASFEVSEDGRTILVPLSGKLYLIERATGKVRELPSTAGYPIDPRFSPDGNWVASVRNLGLCVTSIASGVELLLSETATPTVSYGLAEFVAQEEMARMHGYWFSPDSQSLVYQETNTADVEQWSIPDPAHPERPAQTFRYPRPGKSNARVRLGIVSIKGGKTTWIDWDHEKFPYLARVSWQKNAPLVILVQNREQTLEVLYAVDPTTGGTKELLRETDEAWINLDGDLPRWLRDGKSFLWSTERRGAWQLELRNRDGSLARVLTAPELNYRHLLGVDEAAGAVIVGAGQDPTQTHLYRVPLDKTAAAPSAPPAPAEQLTHEPGVYGAVVSEESGVSVRSSQSLTTDSKQVVYRRDGSVAGELKSAAQKAPFEPTIELTTVGTDPQFHAAIIRPQDFQPGKRYPVIVSVYAGPHVQVVTAARSHYLLDAWIANQGFVVVSLDGRGTPGRGRAWERAIKFNLIEVPLADQVQGLQALGAKYPELDLTRVGVFGWSFGGYFTASAVTRRPDIYHAGVAGAPVTDWLDYDTHYTERYLGVPTKNSLPYKVSSVLEVAPQLRRPLLLIHGTADDNVYFLHSIKLADAFFRAGRPFEFLPLAGQTHMVSEPTEVRELYTRIATYFLEQLKAR
jgi:dipeptidyl-peptidase 4